MTDHVSLERNPQRLLIEKWRSEAKKTRFPESLAIEVCADELEALIPPTSAVGSPRPGVDDPDTHRMSEYMRGRESVIKSIAAMLGWQNTPPFNTIESEIRAMKARIKELSASLAVEAAPPKPSYIEVRASACQSGSDGDCDSSGCPQIRDGEPKRSGRSCPLLAVRPPQAPDDTRVIHSSEIADDPAAFAGDYVPLEDHAAALNKLRAAPAQDQEPSAGCANCLPWQLCRECLSKQAASRDDQSERQPAPPADKEQQR